MRKPIVVWASLVALGIVIGRHTPIAIFGWAVLVVLTALVLVGEAWVDRTGPPDRSDDPRPKSPGRKWAAMAVQLALPALLLVACGGFLYTWHVDRLQAPLRPLVGAEVIRWTGWIVERPTSTSSGRTALIVQVDQVVRGEQVVSTTGRVRLTVTGEADAQEDRGRFRVDPRFAYGDRIVVQSRLREPSRPGNLGEFDEWAWLSRMGVSATARAATDAVRVVGSRLDGRSFAPRATVRHWAIGSQQWLSRAAATGLPARIQPLLAAVVAGDRSALSEDMEGGFRRSGMVHLLSVSGLHVGLMAAVIVGFLRKVLRLTFSWSAAAAIPLIAFYVLLTGAAPPAVRAGFTVCLGLIALARGSPRDVVNAVGAAGLLILAINPLQLFGPSFQLSFVATLGILFGVSFVSRSLQRGLPWIPNRAADLIAVPTTAQISLYPLIAYHFGTFSPVGLIANLGAGSLLGLILPLGLLTAGLSTLDGATGWGLAAWVGWANGWLLSGLVAWSVWFSELPYASIQVVPPPSWALLAYYGALGIFLGRRGLAESGRQLDPLFTRRSARVLLFGTLAGIAAIAWWPTAAPAIRALEVTMIDVGQGDAALVVTPGRRVALIDGGGHPEYEDGQGDFDVGESILVPYLQRRGIERIDWLFVSHAHEDHVEGVAAALRHFPVGEVIDPDVFNPAPSYIEYVSLVADKRITRRVGESGMRLSVPDGVEFRVLAPTRQMRQRFSDDPDNASLVMEIRFGKFRMLFTGDINAEGQRELLRQVGMPANVQSDDDLITVLKVPHHGSRNAYFGPFLDAISPDYAVISVGGNPYGHPHEEVVRALERRGIQIYRTDLDGAITIRTSGSDITVTTAHGRPSGRRGTDRATRSPIASTKAAKAAAK